MAERKMSNEQWTVIGAALALLASIAYFHDDLGDRIAELRGDVAELRGEISGLRERVARVEVRLDGVEQRLDGIEAALPLNPEASKTERLAGGPPIQHRKTHPASQAA